MKRSLALVALTACLTAIVFTGCGKPEHTGAELSEEELAAIRSKEKGDGAKARTVGSIPQDAVESLPRDFALEYTTRTAGVHPSDEVFIMVQPDKTGGFLLTAGRATYEGGTRTLVASVKKKQTEEQCLTFYNQAREAGFFGLGDAYEEEEFGGIKTTVKITANGSTKSVSVYGTRVKEFDLVVSAIQTLSR